VLLACVASASLAGNVRVEVNLDSIVAQRPASDTAPVSDSSSLVRILVPIPRLCRLASCEVALHRSSTEWLDRSVALSPDVVVEAGKAFASLDVGRAVAGGLDIGIDFEPLSADERPARESLLLATYGGQADGIVLRTTECDCWYPDEDTNLAQFFGCSPPEDFGFPDLSRLPLRCDVVIVVSIGGWGRVGLDAAQDIAPTVFAMRDSLANWGLSALIVPHLRESSVSFEGRFVQLAEMFGVHHTHSRAFAWQVADLLDNNPGTRVVLIGLSNGATFAGQVMGQLEEEAHARASAVELGPPWWNERAETPNTLVLDREGKDKLAVGRIDVQLRALFSALVRYHSLRQAGQPARFAQVIHVPGHDYEWREVGPSITAFLRDQLARRTR